MVRSPLNSTRNLFAHFTVRFLELINCNTRCVCNHSQRFVQAPKSFEKDANVFGFRAHLAVGSFELLGRSTSCVCEHSQRFLQASKLFEKGAGVFEFLAHFAVHFLHTGPSDENRQRIKLRETLTIPDRINFTRFLFDLKQINQITYFNNRTNRN